MSTDLNTNPAQATPNAGSSNVADQSKPQGNAAAAAPSATDPVKPSETAAKADGKENEKPAENASESKPVVPEKYELKLPDGSLIDPARVEEIASFAKEQGFSNDTAQKVLERESKAVSGFMEAQTANYKNKVEVEWVQASQSDKEIGGDKFKESTELARRFVERHGSDALKKELDATGFGNHPELIRIFARAERGNANDVAVRPGAQAGSKKSREELFYGKSE